jgi:sterol desaturase/sphingolipid hydroxylase (fatty acid hydroxylase superfamily)
MEEALLRSGASIGIFLAMSAWEFYRPRRQPAYNRRQRWPINLGLAVCNNLLLRLSVGAVAYRSAVWAADNDYGLLNAPTVPHGFAAALTLLSLDLAIYAQHIAAHRWKWFWRLHQVHHTDLDFDASTAVRFHPLEILLSMLYKVALIIAIGADPLSVVAFEIILNGCALFNHGNVYIPPRLDRLLRYAVITPDMHRIHHSALRTETDSNYGFSLSCWDRLFKTYTAVPRQDHAAMTIGLASFRDVQELGFLKLLLLPFQTLRRR